MAKATAKESSKPSRKAPAKRGAVKKSTAKRGSDEKGRGTAWVKDYGILIAPIITEKSAQVGGAGTTVVFEVDSRASKTEIKDAVQRIFNVLVAKVRTANFLGKPKRTMRSEGRRAGYKKAYVTLKEGQKIELVEGI